MPLGIGKCVCFIFNFTYFHILMGLREKRRFKTVNDAFFNREKFCIIEINNDALLTNRKWTLLLRKIFAIFINALSMLMMLWKKRLIAIKRNTKQQLQCFRSFSLEKYCAILREKTKERNSESREVKRLEASLESDTLFFSAFLAFLVL